MNDAINVDMNATKLNQLFAELNQKRLLRLKEIEKDCQARIDSLQQEMKNKLEIKSKKLQQDQRRKLQQFESKAMREAQSEQQQALWSHQQTYIDETLCAARLSLNQLPLDKQSLLSWTKEARKRLGQPTSLLLKIKPQWLDQWAKQMPASEIPLAAAEMLGGAILHDKERQIELDGSWDQRLEALIPQLWQRWSHSVSTDNQD